VTVKLQISGTAVAGSDYEALPDTLVIPAGQEFVNLPVLVKPELYLQGNKTVEAAILPDATYQLGNSSATVTIIDNDLPRVTVTTLESIVNEAGTQPGTVIVTRSGDLIQNLVVNYLVSGTAVSGLNYRSLPGSVTIPAGQPSATIAITPRNDFQLAGDHSVILILSDSPLTILAHQSGGGDYSGRREANHHGYGLGRQSRRKRWHRGIRHSTRWRC